MSKQSKIVFIALQVISWIIFVGLCIEAGALVVNFAFSIMKPEMLKNLYQKLDITELQTKSLWAFYGVYSFLLIIPILKAVLFYEVILLLMKLDMNKPFSLYVSDKIMRISKYTATIGFLGYIAIQFQKGLEHKGFDTAKLAGFWSDYEAFIVMSAVVYIIAMIFRRGLELQNEQDLTV